MAGRKCHDCNCKEGELHHRGCDWERCPFCGGQLISCSCCYEKLNIDVSEGTWAYSHGLTDKQEERWEAMLTLMGKIPHVDIPLFCALCGKENPDFFLDEDWKKYIIPQLQGKHLCTKCYKRMKKLFPNGWIKAKENKNGQKT